MLTTISTWTREHLGWVLVSISAAGQVVSDTILAHEIELRVAVLMLSGASAIVQLVITIINRLERARINGEYMRKVGMMRTAPNQLDAGPD